MIVNEQSSNSCLHHFQSHLFFLCLSVDKVFGQHIGGIFIKLKISQFEVAFPFYVVFLFIIIYFINYLLTADDQHYR